MQITLALSVYKDTLVANSEKEKQKQNEIRSDQTSY